METLQSRLTARRLEALEALQRLTAQAGEAVHYSLVATRLRISALTAYGLMRELENLGLVMRRTDRSEIKPLGGRSRILFLPSCAPAGPSEDEVDTQLRAAFDRFAAIGDEAAAARTFLAETGADLAYQLGFWLSRLEATGRQAGVTASAVLEGGSLPLPKLQTLGAMSLGSVLARLGGSGLAARMAAAGTRFNLVLEEAARASDQSLAALVDAARNRRPGGRHEGVMDT